MTPTLEQLLAVPHIDSALGFDISSDGRRAAFSWNKSGAWEIYEIDVSPSSTDGPGQIRQLTGPPGGKFAPHYSPDGARLAFALDLDGSESYHIAVHDFASGRSVDLTPGAADAHQPNTSWSPDGSALAILSDVGGTFSLYVLPAGGGQARLVMEVGHPCWDAKWSPDGKWIAVDVEWYGQDRSIFVVNVRDGRQKQLTKAGEVLNAMHPAWSPDGRQLAFCADPEGWYRIGLYEMASEYVHWLDGGESEQTSPAWSQDGVRLACLETRGAETSIRVHELRDGTVREHRLEPGIYSHPTFSRDGRRLLFGFENPRLPCDLWQLDVEHSDFVRLTNSLPPEVVTSDFVIPEEVWYPSTDGVMVPAMLYRPKAREGPALVNLHGGPNWLLQCNWHPLMSHLADMGWTVLAPNYRGSTGYGRSWRLASEGRVGEIDTLDCAAAAMFLRRAQLADPARIGVTGRSHGGYLAMTCLTEFPELWVGGSAVVPFMNWFTSHAAARHDLQHWDIQNLGDPVENAEVWRRRSPFFYLDRIRAAVQLICGANDPRCPASESIMARDRLLELGKQVELILYPDEGHGFLKLENVIDHEVRRLAFLEQAVRAPAN